MDLADDVAYSVHDVEDGVVADRIDLHALDLDAVWATVREWYLPDATDAELDAALAGLRAVEGWPDAAYDGSRRHLAALKNLTSDVIGRFCGAVQDATYAARARGPFVRYDADLVVPPTPARDRRPQGHRRPLRDARRRPGGADDAPARAAGRARRRAGGARPRTRWTRRTPTTGRPRPTTPARRRAVVDQVASLTDASAVTWHARSR